MTSATALLRKLTELGIRLEACGDRVRVDAPAEAWTPEIRAEVAAKKRELLDLLRRQEKAERRCRPIAFVEGVPWSAEEVRMVWELPLPLEDRRKIAKDVQTWKSLTGCVLVKMAPDGDFELAPPPVVMGCGESL